MRRFTCPFCIRTYPMRDVLYVCPDCGEATEPEFFEREPISCRRQVGGVACGGKATRRQCPFCRQEQTGFIPKTVLEVPNMPFSIVGVSGAGKTNYITVMLRELGRAAGLRLALSHQTQETLQHQREMENSIFEQHMALPPTPTGEKMPQIWTIGNLNKRRGGTVPTYAFTIFDGAGEDHEARVDQASTECRYINASKAIMLVIDPLVLAAVRSPGVVDATVMRNSLAGNEGETKNASDVINSVVNYIRDARQIRTGRLLDIPVAVVLTKFDTLLDHPAFGPQALVRDRGLNFSNGTVDIGGLEQVHSEIENWLYQIGEGSFISTLESNFREFRFFGVSSLGAPPKDAYTLPDEIKPHRVLDPLLWLFHKERFID